MAHLVLHTCCAPCAILPYHTAARVYDVTFFFYNPNIFPFEEYEKRRDELIRFQAKSGMRLHVLEEGGDAWQSAIAGYEGEREGGARCEHCFRHRLRITAQYAASVNADCFGTVMSVSPHKSTRLLARAGEEAERETGVPFLPTDFKKANGFRKASQYAREEGFYRQRYCGCAYSIREGACAR